MDQQHQPEQHYAGLDVSLDATAICVLDAKGAVVWRGKCASTPEAIRDALRQHAPALVRAGLETGQISNWLTPACAVSDYRSSASMPATPRQRSSCRSTRPTRTMRLVSPR